MSFDKGIPPLAVRDQQARVAKLLEETTDMAKRKTNKPTEHKIELPTVESPLIELPKVMVDIKFEFGKFQFECIDIGRTEANTPQLIVLFKTSSFQLNDIIKQEVVVNYNGDEYKGIVYGGPFIFSRQRGVYGFHLFLTNDQEGETGTGVT